MILSLILQMSFRIDMNSSKSRSWKVTQLGFELSCSWLHSWSSFCFTQCYSTMTNFITYQFLSSFILMTLQLSPWVWAEPLDISRRNLQFLTSMGEKKSKSRATTLTISFTPRYISKENKNTNSKMIYAPEFITAKLWKHLCAHPYIDGYIKM